MKILITGGAGYIGSHIYKALETQGHDIIVLDDLSTGHQTALPENAEIFTASITEPHKFDHERRIYLWDSFFQKHKFDTVIHCAAHSLVEESYQNQREYFRVNYFGTVHLLKAMAENGVKNMVFSSTAGVYLPKNDAIPYREEDPTGNHSNLSPYGASKRKAEQAIRAYAPHINAVIFRFFNAAGAAGDGSIGEDHDPETHLIPNAINAALYPDSHKLKIYGDGSAVRDFVHVEDIAQAHIRALDYLQNNTGAHIFNLGSGAGYTVNDIVRSVKDITHQSISPEYAEPRMGDAPYLVADIEKAETHLRWTPQYDLQDMISSATNWHRNLHARKAGGYVHEQKPAATKMPSTSKRKVTNTL